MANPADVGGYYWTDQGGPANRFRADILNRLRPLGFVSKNLLGVDPLEILVAPDYWFKDTVFETFAGGTLVLPASQVSYVYLDGALSGPAQLVANQSGFPVPVTEAIKYLAIVTTNATEVVEVLFVGHVRRLVGGGVVQAITPTSPITVGGTAAVPIIGVSSATPGVTGAMPGADKTKLDALAYDGSGKIYQSNAGSPSGLAIGTLDQGLRVGVSGLLQYVDRHPPAEEVVDQIDFNTPSTAVVIVPGMTVTPPAGIYLVLFGGSAFMSVAGADAAFLQIRVSLTGTPGPSGAVYAPGSERIVQGSDNVPFCSSAIVTVDGNQAILGTVVVNSGDVTVRQHNMQIIRVLGTLTP